MTREDQKIPPDPRYCTGEEFEKRWDGAFRKKPDLVAISMGVAERAANKHHAEIIDKIVKHTEKKGQG